MSNFIITEWDKSERAYQFVGWRTDRMAIFLLDERQRRQVVQLHLPCPPEGHYKRSPFPESAAVAIKPARLLPPPCRATEAAALAVGADLATEAFFPWETVYGEALWPKPEDDAALLERLERFKTAARADYETRRAELETRTEADVKATVLGKDSAQVLSAEKCLDYIAQEQRALEANYTAPLLPGHRFCGCLNWTLEMVKNGEAGIRDPYLQEQWARQHGFDLRRMSEEKDRFVHFLHEFTVNVNEDIIDITHHTRYRRPGLRLWSSDEQLVCATVRYAIHFANGPRRWLTGYELRAPLDASEQRELDLCLDADSEASQLHVVADRISGERERLEAIPAQIEARTVALADTLAPLTKLYSEPELAEIRKRADGKGVPGLFVDWAISQFQASDPPHLPTKGQAFDHCGPGTIIGGKLEAAGCGISKQRLAAHLTVLRRLLEAKGWLARLAPGKARKRASGYIPDERHEDHNMPTPFESAANRDDAENDSPEAPIAPRDDA